MHALINIDVPPGEGLARAVAFYEALGLRPGRRFGDGAVEMPGTGLRRDRELRTGSPDSTAKTPVHDSAASSWDPDPDPLKI